MANDKSIQELNKIISEILEYKEKELIKRSEWGAINFENFEFSFTRLWELIGHLNVLPIEYLNDSTATATTAKINDIKNKLDQIDAFSLSGNNSPEQTRNQLGNQFNKTVEQLYSEVASWIPFLAYQKSDVAKNIEELSSTIKKAKQEVNTAKKEIEDKKKEIDDIIKNTREASASAGAAVFTQDFMNEANDLEKVSLKWLYATIGLSILTLGFALYMWHFGTTIENDNHIWIKISTKITIFVFLFTATLWTGKIYRAIKHLALTNKHRALGLKTFQAFSSAASNNQVKDAVLLETTRSIFANTPTGFIETKQNSSDGDSKVIEIIKSVIQKEE